VKATELLRLLSSDETVSLAVWHGEPLGRLDAQAWLARLRERLHRHRAPVKRRFNTRLAEMITRYWMGRDICMAYENLLATVETDADKARLELCFGQLLFARKFPSAWQHLDAGFETAAHLFEPEEYFVVLNRHERLRELVLSPGGARAAGLEQLLREAGVIRQLRGKRAGPRETGARHQDTVD
jgi:hypothetical protein